MKTENRRIKEVFDRESHRILTIIKNIPIAGLSAVKVQAVQQPVEYLNISALLSRQSGMKIKWNVMTLAHAGVARSIS